MKTKRCDVSEWHSDIVELSVLLLTVAVSVLLLTYYRSNNCAVAICEMGLYSEGGLLTCLHLTLFASGRTERPLDLSLIDSVDGEPREEASNDQRPNAVSR